MWKCGNITRKREWSQGFQGQNILDVVASTDASACVLQALKQQARADGERRGKDWALECLAGKLLPLSMVEEGESRWKAKKKLSPVFFFSESSIQGPLWHPKALNSRLYIKTRLPARPLGISQLCSL